MKIIIKIIKRCYMKTFYFLFLRIEKKKKRFLIGKHIFLVFVLDNRKLLSKTITK